MSKTYIPSARAQVLTRRTYNRPINEEQSTFETWDQTVDRVIGHQRWLWERAKDEPLEDYEEQELEALRQLMLERKCTTSGRTLWLGGTDVAKSCEASQFNCAGLPLQTVHSGVDMIWLLLQGCGTGFKMEPGVLSGFTAPIKNIEVIRSTATGKTGEDHNTETFDCGVWTIRVGDSAAAWAKAFGKLLVGKFKAHTLVFDFRPIRPAGIRLKGYGWISSGDAAISKAMVAIAQILNRKSGQLLSKIDLLDVGNWMGTVLSSRRSAEIALVDYNSPEWEEFATAKAGMYEKGLFQREQSNNSLLFWHKPSKLEIRGLFQMLTESGGSEPGFINAAHAKKRAPWFETINPCAEILLARHGFCNLVETDLNKFNGDFEDLLDAHFLIARANYRQTCVNLDDGILQRTWHETNEYLRLCGAGVTGVVRWEHQDSGFHWRELRRAAVDGANSMADELYLPRSKAVTTVKPSGTLSKIMDTTEGVHRPMGKYIFNWVNFGNHDPSIPKLVAAGYMTKPNPSNDEATLVCLPVAWDDVSGFTEVEIERDGVKEHVCINKEPAVAQLNRYKMLMDNYVDHNCSITVSYDRDEIPEIVDWLDTNWDSFVGVSWLFRADPTKTAEDLGYLYLPQEVVTESEYRAYVDRLQPVILDEKGDIDAELEDECAGGMCPVR